MRTTRCCVWRIGPPTACWGERAAAEDVAGESLARAYSRWSSVSGHAEAWVVTVATNLALDAGRRRARAAGRQVELIEEGTVDDVDLRLDLQAAVRALPRRQRQVVALRFLADFPRQRQRLHSPSTLER